MSTDRERDAAIDHLLRQSVQPDEGAAPGPCPAADVLAALVENEVPATERAALDAHVAACDRCQRTLALIVDTPAIQAEGEGTRVGAGSGWRPRLRWLVPVAAAATALVVYVAIDTNQRTGSPSGPAASQRVAQAASRLAPADQPASGLAPEANAPSDAAQSGPTGSRAGGGGGGGAMARRKSIAQNQMARAEARKPARGQAPTGVAGKPAAVVAPTQVVAESVIVVQPPAAGEAGAARGAGRGGAAAVPPAAPPPVAADQARKVATAPPIPPAAAPTRVSAFVGGATPAKESPPGSGRPATPMVRSADNTIAWRLGPGAVIAASRDGGVTWQPQTSGATSDLLAGSAPVRTTCWVVGRAGIVLLTTDGEHWQARPFPERVDLGAVAADDERRATVFTTDGRVFTTTDGGATWTPARR